MHGVELTAYLVNESRARRPELARDRFARQWIPPEQRVAVEKLWEEYAEQVYPHDDLVVSLRGRSILDILVRALRTRPDLVLVVCGAGFTSYPWLLPVAAAVEVDLPSVIETKRKRTAELTAAGLLPDRAVTQLALDLSEGSARKRLLGQVRELAAGRPVAFVAEGLVFYLTEPVAGEVVRLGSAMADETVSMVTYWPTGTADNPVLAAQRRWFRQHAVPERASYLSRAQLTGWFGELENLSPEEQQRRYLGEVVAVEDELVPEHLAVAGPLARAATAEVAGR